MRPNVLQALPSKENDTTNLLKALCELTQFREVVLRHFTGGKFGAKDVEPDAISAQQGLGGAIPDMVLEGADVIVVVEIKTTEWCCLTDNQPNTYLKWLHAYPHTANKYFVFLVPPGYVHWDAYDRGKEKFENEHKGHSLNVLDKTDWLDFVTAIEESGITETSIYAQDFCEMIRRRYTSSGISFSLAELEVQDVYSKNAATAMRKILSLIQKVYEHLKLAYDIRTVFNNFWWENGERGFYVQAGNEDVLYFGLWMLHWQDTGNPLCFGVNRDWNPKIVELFRMKFPNNELYTPANRTSCYYLVPVEKHLLMAPDAVEAVVRMLEERYLKDATLLAKTLGQ